MKNITNLPTRSAGAAARVATVALCLAVAPMAFAQSAPESAPAGAGFLLSHGHNYHQAADFQSASIGGNARASRDLPEPATWGMFGLGLAMIGLGAASRRRRAANNRAAN